MKQPNQTIIAVTSNKGGTGKTTVTLGLASGLARKGYKVLMMDLDQQGNLSTGAGCPNPKLHLGDILLNQATWLQTLVRGKQHTVDLIPSTNDLVIAEKNLFGDWGIERNLSELLANNAAQYDFVLLDCPPNLGVMTLMALTAATHYVVPIQGEHFAYKGLDSIRNCVQKVRKSYNPGLRMAGIVMNKFRLETKFGQDVYRHLMANEEMPLFQTRIRQCLALMEASYDGISIFDYDPKSTGAQDFANLVDELCIRLETYGEKETVQL